MQLAVLQAGRYATGHNATITPATQQLRKSDMQTVGGEEATLRASTSGFSSAALASAQPDRVEVPRLTPPRAKILDLTKAADIVVLDTTI